MDQQPIDILIVEDDDDFRDMASQWMTRKGHLVFQARNGHEALNELNRRHFDVTILDMNLPGINGAEVLQRIRDQQLDTEVIILTGKATVENAVEAMKLGACDYLTKPFPLAELEQRCLLAAQRGRLQRENVQLRELLKRQHRNTRMIGESKPMQLVNRLIERVAPTDKAVLIEGESGTGKELVARAIQEHSHRVARPFVTINCAALPETLVESELFGHEKGAFTGASMRKCGLFETADGGTLFIDEIGELPLSLQPKLLRVLEDGSLRRVGSHQERRVNVRVIAATNRDLREEVDEGRFREDLYYRINVMTIKLPPLRQRGDDIDLLIDFLLGESWILAPDARECMQKYDWPGNVRQLINAIDRGKILAEDGIIQVQDLPSEIAHVEVNGRRPSFYDDDEEDDLPVELASVERSHLMSVLRDCKGNKAKAARTLGIHRRKLYRLLEKHGLKDE